MRACSLAFARFGPTLDEPEQREQMKRALASAATFIAQNQADRDRLRRFLESVEATGGRPRVQAEQTEALSSLAREAFGWPAAR